jgi:hypothetical protein
MKAKLINRGNGDYKLYVDETTYATTSDSPYKKLSKQNCDELFWGLYDTEIEVEIVMDAVPADRAPNGWSTFPKLDSNGCLILKRVV